MMAKVLGTAVVWGGVVALCYMFHSFNILDGGGAGAMVIIGLVATLIIWD